MKFNITFVVDFFFLIANIPNACYFFLGKATGLHNNASLFNKRDTFHDCMRLKT